MSQPQQNTFSPTRIFIGYVILTLLFFAIVGLFSVNIIAGVTTIAGIIIYLLYTQLLKSVRRKYLLYIFSAVISLIILCIAIILSLSFLGASECPISFYRIVAIPESNKFESISIQESVILKENTYLQPQSTWSDIYINGQKGYQLPQTVATISSKGFLLKEASFKPSVPCSSSISVELDEFPRNSFFAAHKAQDLKINPYVDTETISWNSSYEEIRFSYMPSFQILKPLLVPLLGASTINQWLMGLLGIIGAFIFTPFVKPVLTEIAQKAIKNKINNLGTQTQEDKKVTDSKKEKKEKEN